MDHQGREVQEASKVDHQDPQVAVSRMEEAAALGEFCVSNLPDRPS